MLVHDSAPRPTPPKERLANMTDMFREASEAGAVASAQLRHNANLVLDIAQRLRAQPPRMVVTCARGSSDHAATYAKYMIETFAGVVTASASPSISSVYAVPQNLENVLYLAISQSGKSPDILASVQAAKDAGAYTVALVNDETSPLARLVDKVLPLKAGPEISVAATKSYIAALVAIAHLTSAWSGDPELAAGLDRLPEHLAEAWALDWSLARETLRPASNLYVIGRGLGLAIAQEAALKFKETCGLHAEAFSAAEVKHGPMAIVGQGFPILAFTQNDESRESVEAMADDMAARGAQVMIACPGADRDARHLPAISAHPALEPILMVQSFYRMVNALSVARGFDPDRPPHLNKVTETV